MLGNRRGPREGYDIAKQVSSVGFLEKNEGAPTPLFFLKNNLPSNVK